MSAPVSLRPLIRNAECLNQDAQFSLAAMMASQRPLRSDCDEQLLMHFSFDAPVRVAQVAFEAAADSPNRPSSVRVFVNERNLIFATVDRTQPVDVVELKWAPHPTRAGGAIAVAALRKAPFLNASLVTLFVDGNVGDDDVTEITGIDILGEEASGQGTSALPKKG